MKIAIFQSEARRETPEQRLPRLAQAAAEARGQGARLLICPELFMSGYNIGGEVRAFAEPQQGPFMRGAAEIAADAGLAILYGYPERDGGAVCNAAALLGETGDLMNNYRKLHLRGEFEVKSFRPGDDFALVCLGDMRIAPLICYDVEFPESVRSCAAIGAELVAVPTALRSQYAHVATALIPTRAFENGLFVAYANHAGQEDDWHYCGLSCIAAPDGSLLAQAGSGEEVIVADIDPARIEAARRAIPYLAEQRADLYRR